MSDTDGRGVGVVVIIFVEVLFEQEHRSRTRIHKAENDLFMASPLYNRKNCFILVI